MKWENNKGDFQSPEPGIYAATCSKLIDLGTQEGSYMGKPKQQRKVFIAWEISEKMDTGAPFQVASFLTQSMSEKAILRKYVESWRGKAFTEEELKAFEPKSLLGKSCMITLTIGKNDKIQVSGVAKLMKDVTPPVLSIEPVYFSLDEYDPEVYAKLSPGIQGIIAKSPEFEKVAEDIPFGVE